MAHTPIIKGHEGGDLKSVGIFLKTKSEFILCFFALGKKMAVELNLHQHQAFQCVKCHTLSSVFENVLDNLCQLGTVFL